MKIAYLDCFSGIAGDMFLGACLDAGLKLSDLKKELRKLRLKEFSLTAKRVMKRGLMGTKVEVRIKKTKEPLSRTYKDIVGLIDASTLDKETKELSKKIFTLLGKAEAKIHNTSLKKVHFHEVGAVDAIVDIVGAVVAVKKLGIQKLYCSSLPLGSGFVTMSHGTFPVPAPATMEILKGKPVYQNTVSKELVTPTGAAIVAALCSHFGDMPAMNMDTIGYGAGTADLKVPNLLRIFLGETTDDEQMVDVIEANIDDMNPQLFDHTIEKLFKEGALDVSLTPVYMKKNRPGVTLSVISPMNKTDRLSSVIFKETTTLGLRVFHAQRKTLEREIKTVKTKYGKIRVKYGRLNGEIVNVMPEYEDCKKIAKKYKIPLKNVYRLVDKGV